MNNTIIKITRSSSDDLDFQELVLLLDQELELVNGSKQAFFSQYNRIDQIKNVVVAYVNEIPAGCGAFKLYEEDIAEIKRMYVKPMFRGIGIAKTILKELETWAKELRFAKCILETATSQAPAIQLYSKRGYLPIENYGQYAGVDMSICMQKKI